MSILCIPLIIIYILHPFPGCLKEPYLAVPCQKLIPSPDGDWVLIAPSYIVDGARKVHDFLTVGAAAPLQEAAVVALNFGDDYYENLKRIYTEKRDFFLDGLDRLGLAYTVPQGAYYVMVDIRSLEQKATWNFVSGWRGKWALQRFPAQAFSEIM